jgi:arginase
MSTHPLTALHVVGIRYSNSQPDRPDETPLDHYQAAAVYAAAGAPVQVVEPRFPEEARTDVETDNLGLLGGQIANAVADGRRSGAAVLVVGGNCSHMTGVVGGLQDVHGPGARIGLVWFDAHGDFNTPRTTLSGMLGGMPVAVSAGLAYPRWRTLSHIAAPLPTDRIVMVDVRNLDPPEEKLIRATDVTITAVAPGFPGLDLQQAVSALVEQCDVIYFHIDADILDAHYVPNHHTKEPNGPNMAEVQQAMTVVIATGKVGVLAIVSVFPDGEGGEQTLASGIELIRHGLATWRRVGMV